MSDRSCVSIQPVANRRRVARSWFKLLPGDGQYSKYFRLYAVWEDMIMVSRTDQSPNLYNIKGTLQTNANEFFVYLWEDMKVKRVDYDLDSATILTSKPITPSRSPTVLTSISHEFKNELCRNC